MKLTTEYFKKHENILEFEPVSQPNSIFSPNKMFVYTTVGCLYFW
jgi:hypothetical protein